MKRGYWLVLASQVELAAGLVISRSRPSWAFTDAVDTIALVTTLVYLPTALAGGIIVAKEKGYHFLIGFYLGLFSIPGLILLALLPLHKSSVRVRTVGLR